MRALIQCGDHLENIHRVFGLAIQLKKKGITPYILVYSEFAESYFINNGIESVSLSLKHKTNLFSKLKLKKTIESEQYNGISLREVIDCDLRKNPNILTPARRFDTLYKVINYIDHIDSIIKKIQPGIIFIWNGYTGLVANTLRCIVKKQNIRSFYLERGLYKDTLFIDKNGVNGFSYLSNVSFENTHKNAKSKNIILKNNKVFLPLQVQKDTNIIYNSPYKTMREFILHVYDLYTKYGINLIVRPHPEEVETNLNLPHLPGITVTSNESVDYWIDNTDATITINSTVGLEAALKGKPVFCFGKSIYSNKKICNEINDPSELLEYFTHKKTSNIEGNVFLNYLINEHTVSHDHSCNTLDSIILDKVNTHKNIYLTSFNFKKMPANDYRLLSDELKRKLKSEKNISFHVYTDLKHNDFLNLTYRKTEVKITRNYLHNGIKKLLNKNTNGNKITISRDKEINNDCVNIMISRDVNVKTNHKYTIVLDRYFNVLHNGF